jgi:hypothetical protein
MKRNFFPLVHKPLIFDLFLQDGKRTYNHVINSLGANEDVFFGAEFADLADQLIMPGVGFGYHNLRLSHYRDGRDYTPS